MNGDEPPTATPPSFYEVLQDLAERLTPIAQTLREAVVEFGPAVAALAANATEGARLIEQWQIAAPRALKEAISSQGLIVPLSQMSLPDLLELAQLEADGVDGTTVRERVLRHYDEIFGQDDFLTTLRASWAEKDWLKPRMPLLNDALSAHEARLYGASIPALLAQFEGLVVTMARHAGRMNGTKMKEYVEAFVDREPLVAAVLVTFVNDAYFAEFAHGGAIPAFSRHAILHGGDVGFATETNSRTAILLIDQLVDLGPRGEERAD